MKKHLYLATTIIGTLFSVIYAEAYQNYGTVKYGGPDSNNEGKNTKEPYCACVKADSNVPADANGDNASSYYGCAEATGNSICSYEIVSGDQGEEAISVTCPHNTIPVTVYVYCEKTSVYVGTYDPSTYPNQFLLGVKNTDNDNNHYVNINGIQCADTANGEKPPKISADTVVSYNHCGSY